MFLDLSITLSKVENLPSLIQLCFKDCYQEIQKHCIELRQIMVMTSNIEVWMPLQCYILTDWFAYKFCNFISNSKIANEFLLAINVEVCSFLNWQLFEKRAYCEKLNVHRTEP